MRQDLTAHDIANGIRMTRAQHLGAFFIVEGETTDLRVFAHLVAAESCQLVPAHGKSNAIDALQILEDDQFQGVLAVVDADFWRLEGKVPGSPNLLITDTHDLETMILKSPALDKVLAEYGSTKKIQQLTEHEGKNLRQLLLACACPIGYLRWISQTEELSLRFEDIRFSRFIDSDCLALDIAKMIKTIKDKSCRHDLEEEVLKSSICELSDADHDPWDVCCGHDLVCILSEGLRKAIGSKNLRDVKPDRLERALRLAYEFAHFTATQLCASLRAWESANRPFQVLPTP